MNIQGLFFLLSTLAISCMTITEARCGSHRISPKKTLKHLRKNYIFVEDPSAAMNRRLKRDIIANSESPRMSGVVGDSSCPWRWTNDVDSSRIPRVIQKAECSDCARHCRPVYYKHKVLFKRCDAAIGYRVHMWMDASLPVAFVFRH
ncbi:uncharacterized protein LOC125560630 [Nematostella vectensis]|uniref:uncharacterized protein LOC125560630 n=1 Tax=Nematostella vectensis TaxID=45351 RepID=UPI0020771282|nr:uncharacterized protein LOC125560630 [Nematostella vectensis]